MLGHGWVIRCDEAWSWTQAEGTATFAGGGSLRTSGNLVENQVLYLPSPTRTVFPSHLLNTKA